MDRQSTPSRTILTLALATVAILLVTTSYAQRKCGTVEYNKTLLEKHKRETDTQFEQWIKQRSISSKSLRQESNPTYSIPVVVHVIHNGEAVGSGTNISDAQILSQIDVLNKDFNRLNYDTTLTPDEFKSVAGKMNIQFVLAKQTPDGLPSNGILRALGTKSIWFTSDDVQLKSLSYWPAEDYFNIWICNLGNDYLGYTQFPVSNLPGLENSPDNRLTDGVVIGYTYFGTTDAGAFNLTDRYDKGRTVTHEVGHFFGLRHIWGDDGNCATTTDYVDDTPRQTNYTSGCPSSPQNNTCTPVAHMMYPNYLDYTDDACMNIFTAGQVTRMQFVLENSVRRNSLLTSIGDEDPLPYPNDAALVAIAEPQPNVCASSVTPSVTVNNAGTNTLSAVQIQFKLNGSVQETINFVVNLNVGESQTVSFSPITVAAGGYDFGFEVLSTNNTTDGKAVNNTQSIHSIYSVPVNVPYLESFSSSLPSNWFVQNPDNNITWQAQSVPVAHVNNTAMLLNCYDYQQITTRDALISPPLVLTNETKAFLMFDLAYAQRLPDSSDSLEVLILTDCQTDLSTATRIYSKTGAALATSLPSNLFFSPTNTTDWRREVIDISSFIGSQNIRIAFTGLNMNGNNIFIDNVEVKTDPFYTDLALTHINSPATITCAAPHPSLTVRNTGIKPVTAFAVNYTVGGVPQSKFAVNNVNVLPGDDYVASLPALSMATGTSDLSFAITDVNNGTDDNTSNDSQATTVTVSSGSLNIPLRENFNAGIPAGWVNVTPSGTDFTWSTKVLSDDQHIETVFANAFGNDNVSDEAWLVTPSLDFSNTNKASLFFDRSYGLNSAAIDELRILVSPSCDQGFNAVAYAANGYYLGNIISASSWTPFSSSDWHRDFVDLSAFAGSPDVRVAFVMKNEGGNNLYIDNLEFYTSDNPNPVSIDSRFSITYPDDKSADFNIIFNLEDQETAGINIYNLMGQMVRDAKWDQTLNQTYPVTLGDGAAGVYVVRIQLREGTYSQKVIVRR